MSKSAIISIVLLVVVALIGFLLLRDGTENVASGTQQVEVVDGSNKSVPKDDTMTEGTVKETKDNTTPTEETQEEDPSDPIEPPSEPPPSVPEESAAVIVTYSNGGFSPSVITISKGETVTFVNESSRNMWPASNIHPVHTVYPEKTASDCLGSAFDACKRVPSGQSWTFTFNQVGSWTYHDHLSLTRTGTIIVQ